MRRPLEPPRVNPVGIVEDPNGSERTPRHYTRWQKSLVLAVLLIFFGVTLVTSAVSLGAYCLTTDGADVRELPWTGQR